MYNFSYENDLKITENYIQKLFQTHPYLIDRRFLQKKVIPQYSLPSGFSDIVVFLKDEIVIIELKVEKLSISHILQLEGYIKDIYKEQPSIKKFSGILIGRTPRENLKKLIESLNFSIQVKILEKDIPVFIKICQNCRLANNFMNKMCEFCKSNKWITD